MTRRCSHGFTLVELLVGLSLLSLLTLLLFGGFRFGLRAWEVGSARLEGTDAVAAAQSLLRREFSEAQPVLVGTPTETTPVLFSGADDRLTFVAPLPAYRGTGGFHTFELVLRPTGATTPTNELMLRWHLYRADDTAPDFDPKDESVVLAGVDAIALSYFGPPAQGSPAQWLEFWDGRLGLPKLVRLQVVFPPGDGRRWPDLIVAPRLQREAS